MAKIPSMQTNLKYNFECLGCVYNIEGDTSGDLMCFEENGLYPSTCIAGESSCYKRSCDTKFISRSFITLHLYHW